MRIFMRYGVDFNHEAIRGKTPQEKDEQVVASHFPEGDYIRLSFKSKVHLQMLGSFVCKEYMFLLAGKFLLGDEKLQVEL